MTLYLSLQVSGGTQPDPQPLPQLLICLYGFILCVKPAHNSITVRVTKLSPECHRWSSLLTAAGRGSALTPPHLAPILSPARAGFRHLLLRGQRAKGGFRGDVWPLKIREKKEAGRAFTPARRAPRPPSPGHTQRRNPKAAPRRAWEPERPRPASRGPNAVACLERRC